jgi:hypothetical protein
MPSRNERCLCGSGKRFKHCHGAFPPNRSDALIANWPAAPRIVRETFSGEQDARIRNFRHPGFHRTPLIAGDGSDRFIVRGEKVFHWGAGGSFLNFLEGDLLREMGQAVRQHTTHPLHTWWKAMRSQAEARHQTSAGGKVASTVAVLNFFTVAHDLFVLADNARPRERLVKSLRVADQFHGARYELMIAACLVRAGFSIEFSDESDFTRRHGDATAQHVRTGRRYSVEMKAKGRPGILGKSGLRPSQDEMDRDVSRLIRDALEKPAEGERLIFVDMNLPPPPSNWTDVGVWWQNDAVASIRAVEAQPGNVPVDRSAFVIFTNLPSHQMPLDEYFVGLEQAFTGFRKPDFASENTLLGERYPDIAHLFDAFNTHDIVPDVFTQHAWG